MDTHYLKYPACYLRLPVGKKMRVGILGGSFNPVHSGHIQTATTALKHLKLDRILWVVSPQNPLKSDCPAPSQIRINAIKSVLHRPDFIVTGFEEFFGIRYSYHTLKLLKRRYKHIEFTFIIGSDNIPFMDKWYRWRDMVHLCAWCVVARPVGKSILHNVRNHKFFKQAKNIHFLNQSLNPESSTRLRNMNEYSQRIIKC